MNIPNLEEKKTQEKDATNIYLSKLVFNPKNFSPLLKGYMTNMRIIVLLIFALITLGLISYYTLPRTLNPDINIPIITVSTILPGASPEDVEDLLTIPLEDEIKSIQGIDILTSSSRESASTIVVQFLSGSDINDAKRDVQSAVDLVTDLPSDVTEPVIKKLDFEDQPILRFAVTSTTGDFTSLNRFATNLKEQLEDLQRIDRVVMRGNNTHEVQLTLTVSTLTVLGLDIRSFASLINAQISSFPAGSVETNTSTFGLTIERGALTLDELRATPLSINGTYYQLGNLATISERSIPGSVPAYLYTPDSDVASAITFDVYRVLDEQINHATADTRDLLQKVFTDNSKRFIMTPIFDVDNLTLKEFDRLFRNLGATILLVFIVLFLFVGFREALVAAFSIPLTFMAAFGAMKVFDISLNFLSLFSLLLSLGLLVDVTIVIVSAITVYYRTGKFTPEETGLLVWKDFLTTLIVTTLTTIWAFVPLLLASGVIGEFIRPIPIIVSAVLASSVLIGFLIILPLTVSILKPTIPRRVRFWSLLILFLLLFLVVKNLTGLNGLFAFLLFVSFSLFFILLIKTLPRFFTWCHKKINTTRFGAKLEDSGFNLFDHGLIDISHIARVYVKILDRILRSSRARIKVILMVTIFFIFSFALVPLGLVKSEFFPKEDVDTLYVSLELPLGTKTTRSSEEALHFLPLLKDTPELLSIQTNIGIGIDADGNPGGLTGSHLVLYTLLLKDPEKRDISSLTIAQDLRSKLAYYNNAKVTVSELSGGPPAGADVTVKFLGHDMNNLRQISDDFKKYLGTIDGLSNIDVSIKNTAPKIIFIPDDEKIADYGLTLSEIGFLLRSFASGFEIDTDVLFSNLAAERKIVVRLSPDVADPLYLMTLSIPTKSGMIPLSSLGNFDLASSSALITRENSERTMSVTANVLPGFNANEINTRILKHLDSDVLLPDGYSWKTGGANEENEKSVQAILQAMVLAFILIFLTLVIQLNSYRKSFIVLLVVPLAISGVFIIFGLFGIPLSFPALIGILALFGIVINNSIVIIDKINANLAVGINFHDAVLDGSSSRLEPIILSSLTTIVGLLPITLSDPLWQGLGGAIIAGLMFSGIVMLFFIPVVYYMIFRKEGI